MRTTLLAFVDVAMGSRVSRRRSEESSEAEVSKVGETAMRVMNKPFFNWRWSVVDVALIVVLVYTFR